MGHGRKSHKLAWEMRFLALMLHSLTHHMGFCLTDCFYRNINQYIYTFDLRPWLLSLDVPMTKEKREEIKIRQVVEKREMVRVSVKKGSSTKSVSFPQLLYVCGIQV